MTPHTSLPTAITDKDIENRDQDQSLELGPLSSSHNTSSPHSNGTPAATSSIDAKSEKATSEVQFETSPGIPDNLQRPISPGLIDTSAWRRPLESGIGEGSSQDVATRDRQREDVAPASMGRETCPICIVDFEEGDDIRVLPCEGKHCFHQNCVDPWLLELSSSCPICRHGMLTLI